MLKSAFIAIIAILLLQETPQEPLRRPHVKTPQYLYRISDSFTGTQMTPRRSIMPRLITSRTTIHAETGREPRPKHKSRCGKCGAVVYTQTMDRGAKYKSKERYEHIGYWCRTCKIFFYLDGSPDYRGAGSV